MEGTWIEVRVITKSEALEPVSGIFYSLDCKGVAIEDPNDILGREQGPLTWDFADINILEHKGNAAVVKAYFSEEDNIEDVLKYIEERLSDLKEMGIDLGDGKLESEKVHEEDWANNWKKYYKPSKVGEKIVVKPIWEEYEAKGDELVVNLDPGMAFGTGTHETTRKYYKPSKVGEKIVVKPIWEEYEAKGDELVVNLDPGMAFGTGTHETTRMCIQSLEKYVKEDSIVFDVGCGSGILAIAAAKLGAKKAVGVDLDPVAVESSLENIQYNDLNNIEVLHGNLVEVIDGKADVVVANILAEIICILTDDVKRVLKKDGYFITSGIIHDRVVEVIDGKADVVVANILAEIICILTDDVKRVLKKDGYFITSGIIHDRVDMVVDKLEKSGFEVIEKNRDGEWNCIVARLK